MIFKWALSRTRYPARLLGVLLSAQFRYLYEARFLSFRTQNARIIEPKLAARKHFHLHFRRLWLRWSIATAPVHPNTSSLWPSPACSTLSDLAFLITGICEGHLPARYHILCGRILSFHADSWVVRMQAFHSQDEVRVISK